MTTISAPQTEIQAVRYGPVGRPKHTLARAAAKWAEDYLTQPDRPIAGQPWRFTLEQMHFLAHWYAIDEDGNFLHTYGVLRRMKGWGKDPLAAVLSAIELVGPCRFGGWNKDGAPKVIPQESAWVQIAATSKDQTRNTMTLFPSLFSKKAVQEYKLDIGKEIIYALGGRAQLQAVTSSPRTLEGARSTFVVLNETQHWVQNNDGVEMAKAIRRNSAKVGGRGLAITNAHRIGEGSVAEEDWLKYQADGYTGEILYDSLEAPDILDTDGVPQLLENLTDDELRACLMAARGDSTWVPVDRLLIDLRDQRDSETVRRRYYLNQIRRETNTWITAAAWDACARDEEVPPGTLITLGFDGARFQDATALVGTVVATGYQWVIAVWQRPEDVQYWECPQDEVSMAVAATFERFRVWRMYCDPYWWEETISTWMGTYGPERVAFFRTNRQIDRMTRGLANYATAVRTGELGHEPDPQFAQHIANAVKKDVNIRGDNGELLYVIQKEAWNSPRKIDIAMAAVLSWWGRTEALANGALQEDVWTFGAA